MRIINLFVAFTFCFEIISCKKLAEVPPPSTRLTQTNVFSTDETAISVMTGVYSKMASTTNFATGVGSISVYAGLSADEFNLYSGVSSTSALTYYFKNALISTSAGTEFWTTAYSYIFTCNSMIEGLANNISLTPGIQKQLMGEAKFVRAFCYLYIISLYGDVPLVTTTDYTANSSLIRSPKVQVLEQVISDLKDAQSMLSMNYIDGKLQAYSGGSIERLRPTFWAATALLARAYLYKSDYVGAEAQANSLINNGTVYKFASLDSVFLKNSTEAIWQLQPVNAGHNTEDAWVMVLPSTGPTTSYPVYLNQNLLSAFEPNDKRKVKWVNSVTSGIITYSYPYKYKSATLNASITEYLMVLRLAEQYLIRAEARAQQGNTSGALSDLNAIRARATLDPFVTTDKATLLAAILHERQVELFTEWGHRWLDLKRFGAIDAVMSIVTPQKANNAPWQSYQQLYPVPVADILLDPNLSQNDKY